jgi:hypothetical protein
MDYLEWHSHSKKAYPQMLGALRDLGLCPLLHRPPGSAWGKLKARAPCDIFLGNVSNQNPGEAVPRQGKLSYAVVGPSNPNAPFRTKAALGAQGCALVKLSPQLTSLMSVQQYQVQPACLNQKN